MPSTLEQPRRAFVSGLAASLERRITPAQSHQAELLDAPGVSKEVLEGNFVDLRRINRWFGGVSLVAGALEPLLPDGPARLKLLDLACGAADVPLALARRWQKRGIELEITAVDLNPTIAQIAGEAARRQPGVTFEAIAADVFQYSWPPGQPYDFVTCSLAFHHFQPQQCIEMLRVMSRLCKRGFVVNDLRRSLHGWALAHLMSRTVTRHPLTRHDAPLSIRRSFTVAEMQKLVEQANLGPHLRVTVEPRPFSRLAVVGKIKQEG